VSNHEQDTKDSKVQFDCNITGATIPVVVLPAMLAGGFVIVQLVQSVATLVQYGCWKKGNE
jgi:hypothetical protein